MDRDDRGRFRMVEPQATGTALTRHPGGDMDEQAFLLVWE
jgi:hypothetical protein